MKQIAFLFVITILTTLAFATEEREEELEVMDWQYSCTVTDANYGHYWGASNRSQEEAYTRAMNDCYRHSDAMGTCALVSCN